MLYNPFAFACSCKLLLTGSNDSVGASLQPLPLMQRTARCLQRYASNRLHVSNAIMMLLSLFMPPATPLKDIRDRPCKAWKAKERKLPTTANLTLNLARLQLTVQHSNLSR